MDCLLLFQCKFGLYLSSEFWPPALSESNILHPGFSPSSWEALIGLLTWTILTICFVFWTIAEVNLLQKRTFLWISPYKCWWRIFLRYSPGSLNFPKHFFATFENYLTGDRTLELFWHSLIGSCQHLVGLSSNSCWHNLAFDLPLAFNTLSVNLIHPFHAAEQMNVRTRILNVTNLLNFKYCFF